MSDFRHRRREEQGISLALFAPNSSGYPTPHATHARSDNTVKLAPAVFARPQLRVWTVGLWVLHGCAPPPDPSKTLEQVASYLATATLAGDAWIAHRTPNPFTRNTLRKARMSIADQQTVLFSEAVPAVDTTALRQSLQRSKNTLASMEQLVDVANQPLFTAQLAVLKIDAQRVKDMSDALQQRQQP